MLLSKFVTHKVIPFVMIVMLLAACAGNERVENGVYYSHDDFKKEEKLKGSFIDIPLRGKPIEYLVLRDSIVLINYWEAEDCLVDMVNMHSGKLLRKLGKKGSEKGALVSASLRYKSPLNNYFVISDGTKNLLVRYNIDSLLNNESYIGEVFDVPSFAGDATFWDHDSILLFNSYFLKIGDSVMNANSNSPLLFVSFGKDSVQKEISSLERAKQPKYFTPNVTGGSILVNPKDRSIWLVDNFFDRITVYDKDLHTRKYLLGPEKVKINYELRPDNAVYFKKGMYCRSFYPGIYSENAVYLLYLGIKGIDLDHTGIERPVTLLKFDWNGTPVQEYKLDRYIYNMSLSPDEKVLYGTTAGKFGDTARLIKYNL